MISYPLSGYLCTIPVDNGWPFAFYVPGALAAIWYVLWWFLTYNGPDVHPRISEEEKRYIMSTTERVETEKQVNCKQLLFVWKRVTYLFNLTESVVNTMAVDHHFSTILGHFNCSHWTRLGVLCSVIGVANIHENSTPIRSTVGSYCQYHFIYKIILFD